jgi:hypothetical protein
MARSGLPNTSTSFGPTVTVGGNSGILTGTVLMRRYNGPSNLNKSNVKLKFYIPSKISAISTNVVPGFTPQQKNTSTENLISNSLKDG